MSEEIIIHQIPLGMYQVMTYLIICAKTQKAAVIDPAGEAERLIRMAEDEKAEITYILNTHGHPDHVAANRQLKKVLQIPVCMHEADDDFFSDPDVREIIRKEISLSLPEPADIRLKDGQVLEVGQLKIRTLHTPGHTPGSACFSVSGHLFTGDTLFVGDVGRTDLVGGSLETLIRSIETRIMPLPDATVVWPGHRYGPEKQSTLAREKRENPYITDFIQITGA